jgi:hypothetical protein
MVSTTQFLEGAEIFLFTNVQTRTEAHTASYPSSARGSFSEVKQPKHEADYMPPPSTKVKKAWSYTSTPPISSWRDV